MIKRFVVTKHFPHQIADNPELLNVKPWNEFKTLGEEEQREIYEKLLSLIRKLILERNELTQVREITLP